MTEITKLPIEQLETLQNKVIIDTRTPSEYKKWHIPGAINIPLLSDEERAIVGIIYKKLSQEDAVKKGYDIVMPKLEIMMSKYEPFKEKNIVIYCWRGGMRSLKVATWLVERNFKHVYQLEGGIKAHRTYIKSYLDNVKLNQKLVVLWGKTGVGKTLLIRQLENSLDLEDLAKHRSSVYGNIGLEPITQKNFDAKLYNRLKKLEKYSIIYIEGESRKIGDIIIPENIYKQIRNNSYNILVEASLQTRINVIYDEYFNDFEHNQLAMIRSTESLTSHLGKEKVKQLLSYLTTGKYKDFIKILLLEHYDPKYLHILNTINFKETINNDNVEQTLDLLKNKNFN